MYFSKILLVISRFPYQDLWHEPSTTTIPNSNHLLEACWCIKWAWNLKEWLRNYSNETTGSTKKATYSQLFLVPFYFNSGESDGTNSFLEPIKRRSYILIHHCWNFFVEHFDWKKGHFNEIVWMVFCCKRSFLGPQTTDRLQTVYGSGTWRHPTHGLTKIDFSMEPFWTHRKNLWDSQIFLVKSEISHHIGVKSFT